MYDSKLEEIMHHALKQIYIDDEDFCHHFPIRSKYGYTLDFAFPKLKIGVECDGRYWHPTGNNHDGKRDAFLKKSGWCILRFTDDEIINNIKKCINKIKEAYYERNKSRSKSRQHSTIAYA